MGYPAAYLPGLTMRRIADLYPGEDKIDAHDAFVIADAARLTRDTLRSVDLEDETIAELEMIVGFDDDLTGEATRISNWLHGLLTQIHPSSERVLGRAYSTWPRSSSSTRSDSRTDTQVPDGAGS